MPNGGDGNGGLAEGINDNICVDNIGGDSIGFVTNANTCDDVRKTGVVKQLKCYSEQVEKIHEKRKRLENSTRQKAQKARDRNLQLENLLKKIRFLLSLHPWLKQEEYAHLIPDGIRLS